MPIRAGKKGVSPFFRGKRGARLYGGFIYAFKKRIGKGKVRFAFPCDAFFCQNVVVAAHAEADRTVAFVRNFGIRKRVKIQVDNVIQSPHRTFGNMFEFAFRIGVDIAQHERSKIAHDKIARRGRFDDKRIAVFVFYFALNEFDAAHILRDFRT